MNPIQSQTQILDELCRLIHISAEEGYKEASCRFDYSTSSDGSISVGAKFSYELNGERKSAALVYPERKKLGDLVPKLHQEMKIHTDGNWIAFTLTLDSEGKARTHFEYPKK